jgi:hypothetical protein
MPTRHAALIRIALVAAAMQLSTVSARAEDYGVFCASRRIEVDSRSEDEMRRQRGACQFRRFSTRSDAEGFARRNFGGVGASCSCR